MNSEKKNDNFYLLKNFLINCLSDPKPSKRLTYFFFSEILYDLKDLLGQVNIII